MLKGLACFGLGLFFISLSACSSRAVPSLQTQQGQQTVAAPEPVKTGWETEWEKTLKAAQKEGKIVLYAVTPGPAAKESVPLFKKKFGIDLEVTTGEPAEVRNRLAAERKNGLYLTDMFMTGMNSIFSVSLPQKWGDAIEPELILPEVKNPDNWFGGTLPWRDPEHKVLSFVYYSVPDITINTTLVGHNEITSYYDLLAPKWKDKILIGDARVAGTAFNSFSTWITNKVLDADYYRKLLKQGPVVRDEQLNADWVAKGKYPLTIMGATSAQTARYKEAGAPIDEIEVKEGSYLTVDGSGTMIMNQRPHPNATRIFLNWWFSKEGQLFAQKAMRYHSARTDIGTEGADPLTIRQPGKFYYPSSNLSQEWLTNEQEKYQKLADEIFSQR